DVSRWGRFQDVDEPAFYEFVCRTTGISIHYCAEPFENDGSVGSSIIKTLKRAMAGEYSRELSTKVFAGQCRLIELGFRQGGSAGYGLRRVLVDERRLAKAQLTRGERKSLQTDRVILMPGPPEEIAVVRQLYRMFVVQRRTETEIAVSLNAEGLVTDSGRPWTRGIVHQILTNEKYIGNNIFNRVSYKLKQRRVVNPREDWIRSNGVFEGIVELDFFEAAQRIIAERCRRLTDDELLEYLSKLLADKGWLSGIVIDEMEGMPSSSTYRSRFGSLIRAYHLIGYVPARDFRYVETNRALRTLHPEIVGEIVAQIRGVGGTVDFDVGTDLLHINEEFTASVIIARCHTSAVGSRRWKLRLDYGLQPDITVAVRMAKDNATIQDYYILPWIDVGTTAKLRLGSHNDGRLDAFRFETLDAFLGLTRRTHVRLAA
ncbi:MAG: putative recombinase, partial [Candidatus Sulfotelmatobacter sp.]|nr:putative recombinase [Candidatus Sulfotelmatobacter sp.]